MTAAAGAFAAAVVITAVPAQGASGASGSVVGGTPTPTPSATSTDTPMPTPTPTPPQATSTPTTPIPSPSPTATGPPDDRLLPDLVALAAAQPRVQVVRDGRLLRFTSSLGNVGLGPVEVRRSRTQPCPRGQRGASQIIYRDANGNGRYNPTKDTAVRRQRAGCMVYHRHHNHWHFQASARYTLSDPSRESRLVVAARRKVSFCLRDSARVPARYGTFAYRQSYGACTRERRHGISVGWMDVYQRFLPGQSLRLPRNLRPGVYCLETTVDPLDQLIESNNANNKSVRALLIKGNSVVVRETRLCR